MALTVALALLAAMFATEPGTRWLAASIDWWAGDRMRVGEVSGRLAQTVRVRDFELRHPSLDLTASDALLSWDPAKLLAGEAHVSALAMDGVRLVLHETPTSTDAVRPAGLAFRLAAPSVTVSNVIVVAGGEEIPVESVTLSAHLTEGRLTVADLNIAGTTWRLSANGTVVPVKPFELDLHAQWTSHVDGTAQEGRLTIAGNSNSLDFDAAMQAPFGLRSSGRLRRTPNAYEVVATGAWQEARWPLVGPPSVRSREGRFELGGALDALSLALDLDLVADRMPSTRLTVEGTGSIEPSAALPFAFAARWRAVTASDATLSGELDASGDIEHVVLRPSVHSPFAASAEAALSLGDEASFEAVAQWSGLFWPLAGTQVVTSPEGRLEARGTAALTELGLTAALEAPERVRDGHVSATATVSVIGETDVSGSFAWDAEIVSHGARLRGAGTAYGNPSGVLRFSHALSAPFAVSSTGEVTIADPAPEIRMVSEWVDLRWPKDGPDALSSPRGVLEVQGWLDDFHAVLDAGFDPARGGGTLRMEARGGATAHDGHVDVEWRASLADGRSFAGRGRVDGGTDQARVTHVLTVPFELTTKGVVDSPVAAPELRLTGAWRDLRWPPDRSARYRSAGGTYTLNGPMDALEVRVDGTLDVDSLPPAHVTMTGTLDDTGVDLEPLMISTLGGQATARGRVRLRPGVDWNLEIDAHGLDPGRWWPQWNGTLDAAAVVQGRMVDRAPHTTVDVRRLHGRLRDHPVEGRGTVAMAGERLRMHDVSLRSGDNRLELDGEYHREMDLAFSLEAPNLSAVLPEGNGRLAGKGVLRGSAASPRMTIQLAGQDMRYRDWAARRLEVDVELSNPQLPSRVMVQVEGARVGQHPIESVELGADGTLAAHTAHAAVRSSLGDLDLRFSGGMEAGRWLGELVDTTLVTSGGETWRLVRASELSVDADRVRIERTCLSTDTGANACADLERTPVVRSSIGVEAVPLSVLRPWLPAESNLTGVLDAEGAWSLDDGRLGGNVAASVSPGELTVLLGQDERLSVAHADTELNIMIAESRAEIDFHSVLGGDGPVRGHLLVEGQGQDASLDGTIEMSLPRLDPIAAFVAGPLAAEGEAFIEARIGGTVGAPRARGVARIEVDRAQIHDLGIELFDSRVEARADDGQRVAIDGVLRSGDGHLNIDGSGLLEAGGGWTANELVVTGQLFEIVRLPEAVVTVSPDLTVAAVGDSLEMNGRMVVPWARITPSESTEDAVGVSGDEVLVDRTGTASQPESDRGPDVVTDLVVALGDDVVFDGYGLLARLSGDIRVRHAPGGVLEAFGTLDLVDGQFTLYGQRLDIEHGRVTLAGPLNDPGLDIRAVRRTGDATAGIIIGGTVSDPSSRVFSEPPLEEAEAFSLLLTGRTVSSADEREAALLSQAALNLGLEGAERIGMRIRSVLGIDELSVGGLGDAGDASLILGKRLSADLGVRYVHSLVRQTGSVFVNYRLTEHLSLEAESGVRQGLDLLFSIERDDAS